MKKKMSIVLFSFSTALFAILLILMIDFIVRYHGLVIETSGDFLGSLILYAIYFGIFLVISVLGLGCAIPGAIITYKRVMKILIYIEVVCFSSVAVFSVLQLLLHFL